MRRPLALALVAALVAAAGFGAFLFLSAPRPLAAETLAAMPEGDAERGELVFWAGGCASCHAAPQARGDDLLLLTGGVRLATDFGTFVAPNISPHPTDGIGAWSAADLANAMMRGVSPAGEHYFPAFPYTSYTRMEIGDVADLFAFLQTLPPVEGRADPHQVGFPFNVRRGLGLWKMLYLRDDPAVGLAGANDQVARGQYIVEALAHCGECHTPRRLGGAGGSDTSRWLAGAVAAEGERRGRIPNITPSEDGIGSWSEDEIAALLESGFTPDFDSVGGAMAAVVRTMSRLPDEDRAAVAAYLKAIPPR